MKNRQLIMEVSDCGRRIDLCCTLTQMVNYTSLNGYLDHLINSLTGFPLKINEWLIIYFIIFPVYCSIYHHHRQHPCTFIYPSYFA